MAEGHLERDAAKEASCEGRYYRWVDEEFSELDVVTDGDGTIASFGMFDVPVVDVGDGLSVHPDHATAEGVGILSVLGHLHEAYGSDLQGPVRMDNGLAGVFYEDDGEWIGFLLDAAPEDLVSDSLVTFIEVSVGARPGLMRDGC